MEECLKRIMGEEYWDFIYEYGSDIANNINIYDIYCPQIIDDRFVSIYVEPQGRQLGLRGFSYTSIPKLYGLMELTSVENTGAIRLQNIRGFGLTGENVIIGFVDTGIDYMNKAFLTSTGQTRILSIWDQSDNTGMPPDGLFYGTEYTSADINEALDSENPLEIVPHMDENGHGTFLAGVACGTADTENAFASPAPESMIAMVKLKNAKKYLRDFYFVNENAQVFQENDIMLGVRYLKELAEKERKPIVIIVGLGTSLGDHAGGEPLGQVINEVGQIPGCCVVTCSGNEGNAMLHYEGEITEDIEYEDVEIKVGENEKGFTMEIWGQPPDIFSVGIVSPFGEVIEEIPARVGESRKIDFLLENTVIDLDYNIVESGNGSQLIFLRFSNPTEGVWTIRVYGRNLLDGTYNVWLPLKEFLWSSTYFLKPSPNITITAPGNSMGVITVSAHNGVNEAYYQESGRGYTRLGNVKPDLSAPGVNVTGPSNNPRVEGEYTRKSGSSVSAALTGGVCAQFLEWGIVRGNEPYMKTAYIKNYLIRGARREAQRSYPNRQNGYGMVDAYQSFRILTTGE